MPLKTKKEGETKLFQDIGSMENTFESFRIRAEPGALECDLESSANKKTCSKTTIWFWYQNQYSQSWKSDSPKIAFRICENTSY